MFMGYFYRFFGVFRPVKDFVYICPKHRKSGCNTGSQSVKLGLLSVLRADFLFLQADFLFDELDKTGSQPVNTGSQPVKQEVNKVFKTGFLFYSLTTCVMGRCKQIWTYFLLSADASLDIASLTKTTFTYHLSQPTEDYFNFELSQ